MAGADSNSVGIGQQDPSDSNSDNDVTMFICRQMLAELEKMKLVQVVAVHGGGNSVAAAGTVDVQLLVNQVDGGSNAIDQGVVYSIPWYRLQGGHSAVIIDPVVGDIGYVLCEDRDISGVRKAASGSSTKVRSNPGSWRRNNISDGIYVGSVLMKDVPTQYLWLKPNGGFTLQDSQGNKIDCDSSSLAITDKAGNVVTLGGSGIGITPKSGQPVTVNGDLNVTGEVKHSSGGSFVTLTQHIHAANNTPPTPGH
jgi:hypothetical protein